MCAQLPAPRGSRAAKAFAERERKVASIAARQHGVISRRQLVDAGLGVRAIGRRLETGRLHRLHREVYALGHDRVGRRGAWMAAVLACGRGALLSHGSAAALWGLARPRGGPVDVTAAAGRRRPGIAVHEGAIADAERGVVAGIPVTKVERTLFDLAEVLDERQLERAFEEADRLGLLDLSALEGVCARGHGRRALRPVRRLIDGARAPLMSRSELENAVLELCRDHELPMPQTNVAVLGHEVDAFWPKQRLIVEADGYGPHGHRGAFERDRGRDAERQVAGYRVIRITDRRIKKEPEVIVDQLRRLLAVDGNAQPSGAVGHGSSTDPDEGRAGS